jgi:hypothetical protein
MKATFIHLLKQLCASVFPQLYTDRYVVHAVHKAAILHSQACHQPIYRYNFAYRGLYSFADLAEIGSTHMNLGE